MATADQLHILQHALGVDCHGQGAMYRSHFVTGEGSMDHADCCALVDAGLMRREFGHELTGGMDVFYVTNAGRDYVRANSPPPPRLSSSQRRYRRWLDADCGLTFGEFVKRGL